MVGLKKWPCKCFKYITRVEVSTSRSMAMLINGCSCRMCGLFMLLVVGTFSHYGLVSMTQYYYIMEVWFITITPTVSGRLYSSCSCTAIIGSCCNTQPCKPVSLSAMVPHQLQLFLHVPVSVGVMTTTNG